MTGRGFMRCVSYSTIYSDKRFEDGWGHTEAMAINSRIENRKPQPESQPIVQPTVESEKPKPLAHISEENPNPYFNASIKGMWQNSVTLSVVSRNSRFPSLMFLNKKNIKKREKSAGFQTIFVTFIWQLYHISRTLNKNMI